MRIVSPLLFSLIFLTGCRALKPSANLNDFSIYFSGTETVQPIELGQIRVTFFGTSTLLFDDGETQLLVDGFFTRPPISRVLLGKVKSNPKLIQSILQKHQINKPNAVFVCHSHYDHAMDAPMVCKLTGAMLHGSSSTLFLGMGEKLPTSQMQLYQPGKEIRLGQFTVRIIESKHTPPFKLLGKTNATDPAHPNITKPLKQPAKAEHYIEGGTYDIYIKHGRHSILVKASTNYIANALNNYPVDVLFLGTAMLGKQTPEFQNEYYKHTVAATGARTVIPVHWDNFSKPLSKPLEALPNLGDDIDNGFRFLISKTEKDNVEFKLLQGERSIVLF